MTTAVRAARSAVFARSGGTPALALLLLVPRGMSTTALDLAIDTAPVTLARAPARDRVACEGDLSLVPLTDVLQLLDASAMSGTLHVHAPDGTRRLFIAPRTIVGASSTRERDRLGFALHRRRLLPWSAVALLLPHLPAGLRLGDLVATLGLVDAPTLDRVAALQLSSLALHVAFLRQGSFRFVVEKWRHVPGTPRVPLAEVLLRAVSLCGQPRDAPALPADAWLAPAAGVRPQTPAQSAVLEAVGTGADVAEAIDRTLLLEGDARLAIRECVDRGVLVAESLPDDARLDARVRRLASDYRALLVRLRPRRAADPEPPLAAHASAPPLGRPAERRQIPADVQRDLCVDTVARMARQVPATARMAEVEQVLDGALAAQGLARLEALLEAPLGRYAFYRRPATRQWSLAPPAPIERIVADGLLLRAERRARVVDPLVASWSGRRIVVRPEAARLLASFGLTQLGQELLDRAGGLTVGAVLSGPAPFPEVARVVVYLLWATGGIELASDDSTPTEDARSTLPAAALPASPRSVLPADRRGAGVPPLAIPEGASRPGERRSP